MKALRFTPSGLFRTGLLLLAAMLLAVPAAAQRLTGKSRVRVGVVLPLKEKTQRGAKMVEFYQGLLMAVDSMRTDGLSTEVVALHSGTSAQEMETLLQDNPLEGCDVVFGPLDAAQLPPLATYCHEHGLRLVVPFSTLGTQLTGHPFYYMASAPRTVVQREAAWYIQHHFTDAHLVILSTEDPNEEGRTLIDVVRTTVDADRPITLLSAAADDNAFAAAIPADGRQTLLLLDGSSLKALNTTLPRLRDFHRTNPEARFALFGYPAWQTYTGQLLPDFYAFDTYVYTTFYRNPLSPRTREFDSRFVRWFHRPMQATFPRYGQVGFDLGYYFLRGLSIYGDRLEQAHATVPTAPYQTPFWFEQAGETDGFVNHFVELVHYTPQQTIDLLTRNR